MEPLVQVTLVVVAGILGPVILSWLQGRARTTERKEEAKQRKLDRDEDWARQDAVTARTEGVAQQAKVAAQLLLEKQLEGEGRQAVVASRLLAANTVTNGKLDIIHTLVNSNMTAAMQNELDGAVRELAMMHEVIRLNRAAGLDPTVQATAALEVTEQRISELGAQLEDRRQQAKTVEAQLVNQAAREGP